MRRGSESTTPLKKSKKKTCIIIIITIIVIIIIIITIVSLLFHSLFMLEPVTKLFTRSNNPFNSRVQYSKVLVFSFSVNVYNLAKIYLYFPQIYYYW